MDSFVCRCAELVDACKAYLQYSMRTGSPEWLWAVACIANALSYQGVLSAAISKLTAKDATDHTASTPLASAVRLLDALSAADERARAAQQVRLLRKGVGEACGSMRTPPEVLVVVIIMRMDQVAAGRPLTRDSGVYRQESNNKKRHCSSIGSTNSTGKNSSSSSSSSSQEWPEVPDELILSLLKVIDWANLEPPELAALYNQTKSFSHRTPAAEYVCSQLLKFSVGSLMQPEQGVIADNLAGWVEWGKGYTGDMCALKVEGLTVHITAELNSDNVEATVPLNDEGMLALAATATSGPETAMSLSRIFFLTRPGKSRDVSLNAARQSPLCAHPICTSLDMM